MFDDVRRLSFTIVVGCSSCVCYVIPHMLFDGFVKFVFHVLCVLMVSDVVDDV